MNDNNEFVNNLINNVLQSTMVNHENEIKHLNSLTETNDKLMKEITFKLIFFIRKNCTDELKKVNKNYEFVNDKEMGYQLLRKGEEDLNSVYELERCIDKHTGVNKKIYMNETQLNEVIRLNKNCNRTCIETYKIDNSEKELSRCFDLCFEEYYKNHLYLLQNYSIDLTEVKNKIENLI